MVLVLLIVFMMAAPLATVDVPADLPASNAQPRPRPDKPAFLTVKADRALLLGEAPVAREALGAALDRETGGDREGRVFVRAASSVPCGELMEAMNALRAAGYLKVALVALDASRGP